MTTGQKYALWGSAAALALLALLYLWLRKRQEPRDRLDDILIAGAESSGRGMAAERLRQARTAADEMTPGEWATIAVAILASAIVVASAGFYVAGGWGAVVGAVLGVMLGAVGSYSAIRAIEETERAEAEADILIPQIPVPHMEDD